MAQLNCRCILNSWTESEVEPLDKILAILSVLKNRERPVVNFELRAELAVSQTLQKVQVLRKPASSKWKVMVRSGK